MASSILATKPSKTPHKKQQQTAHSASGATASTDNFKFPGAGQFVCVDIHPPRSTTDGICITTFDPDLLYMFTLWAKQNGFVMGGKVKRDRTLVVRPPATHHLTLRKLFIMEIMNEWQYDLVSETYSTAQTRIAQLTFKKRGSSASKTKPHQEENLFNKIDNMQTMEGAAAPAYTNQ